MDGSWLRELGPEGMTRRAARQTPLTRGDLRRLWGLVLAYPIATVILVATVGVSAARVVEATVSFVLLVALQLVLLSPQRRRQAFGRKPAADVGGRAN